MPRTKYPIKTPKTQQCRAASTKKHMSRKPPKPPLWTARLRVGSIPEIVGEIVGMLRGNGKSLRKLALVNWTWNDAVRRIQWAYPTEKMFIWLTKLQNRDRARQLVAMMRGIRVLCVERLCRTEDIFAQPLNQLKSVHLAWDAQALYWKYLAFHDVPNSQNFLRYVTDLTYRYRGGPTRRSRELLALTLVSLSRRSAPTPSSPRTCNHCTVAPNEPLPS